MQSDTITTLVKEHVSNDSIIDFDDSTFYIKLKNIVKEHHSQIIPKTEIGKILPWVHIAISNVKRMMLVSIMTLNLNIYRTI